MDSIADAVDEGREGELVPCIPADQPRLA